MEAEGRQKAEGGRRKEYAGEGRSASLRTRSWMQSGFAMRGCDRQALQQIVFPCAHQSLRSICRPQLA